MCIYIYKYTHVYISLRAEGGTGPRGALEPALGRDEVLIYFLFINRIIFILNIYSL